MILVSVTVIVILTILIQSSKIIASCKADVVRSNKHVSKTTRSEDEDEEIQ